MEHIMSLLMQYRYWILFPLAVVEGPILAVIAGFLCVGGFLNPFIILPIIIAGDLTGDSLCYLFGRFGWPPFLKKLALFVGIKQEKIERVRGYFEAYPGRIVSLSKITVGIGFAGIYLAGRLKVPYRKFIRICFITSFLQYIIYLSLGLLFGSAYQRISHYLNFFAAFILVLAGVVVIYFIIQSIRKKL